MKCMLCVYISKPSLALGRIVSRERVNGMIIGVGKRCYKNNTLPL